MNPTPQYHARADALLINALEFARLKELRVVLHYPNQPPQPGFIRMSREGWPILTKRKLSKTGTLLSELTLQKVCLRTGRVLWRRG